MSDSDWDLADEVVPPSAFVLVDDRARAASQPPPPAQAPAHAATAQPEPEQPVDDCDSVSDEGTPNASSPPPHDDPPAASPSPPEPEAAPVPKPVTSSPLDAAAAEEAKRVCRECKRQLRQTAREETSMRLNATDDEAAAFAVLRREEIAARERLLRMASPAGLGDAMAREDRRMARAKELQHMDDEEVARRIAILEVEAREQRDQSRPRQCECLGASSGMHRPTCPLR